MRHICILLALFFTATLTLAQPKHEVRAVWLTTIGGLDWPHSYAQSARSAEKQKAELRATLDQLQRAGINTVLLQTRIRATVIYPSAYEPWDGCLSGHPGKSPGYDALAFAVDECHKRGMEIHAWVVAIPIGKWNGTGCTQLRRKQPKLVRRIGDEGYLNPENSLTASYISNICGEIVDNYDVDGIHLDYIRYPETWPIRVTRQQGRQYITNIVRAVCRRVKSAKPWVKMSCSPVGKYDDLSRYSSHGWNAYTTVCQDAQGWLREGIMDELFPMMYFRGNQFYPFAIDWKENSHGRIVAPGLGIYFMSPKEKNWPLQDVTRELEVLRGLDMGHAYFRSKFLTDNTKGLYDFASHQFSTTLALVPPMTWQHANPPAMPSALQRVAASGDIEIVSWTPASRDTVMTAYNVYSSRTYPVDTNDALNLVAVRQRHCQVAVPADANRFYAVTATDRYGNESAPLQEQHYDAEAHAKPLAQRLLPCDGTLLRLPDKGSVLDANYVTIETMLGQIVDMHPYNTPTVRVDHLSDGVYVLRSVGRKGVTHRLGHFAIRRMTK